MYLKDSPIEKQEQDLLHRSNFAKKLAKSLVDAKVEDGFCVGLFGTWGSGKSSIVNMIIEEINRIINEGDKPIVIYFNPWNFSSSEQLLQQYFLVLANKFDSYGDKKLKEIGEAIRQYGSMINAVVKIGTNVFAGNFVLMLSHFFSGIVEKFGQKDEADLIKQRDSIIKKLEKANKKIIVIMDDIDRLSSEEVKLVFKLVTLVAKFPNTIYLLAFDREIVAKALSEVQKFDGEKYLEKIIQIPIEIPKISNKYLWEILFSNLDEIVDTNKIFVDRNYWGLIFSECVSKYIKHVRDVVRLSNILKLKGNLIGEEVNFADLVAVTVLEIKVPELYRWIRENKELIFGNLTSSILRMNAKAEDIDRDNLLELERVNKDRAKEYYELLKLLFPSYPAKSNYSVYSEDEMLRSRRIGHQDVFDRYFMLDLNEEDIYRSEFDYAVFRMSEDEVRIYLEKIRSNNSIINFLNDLRSIIDEIKSDRAVVLIRALFSKAHIFIGVSTDGFISVSSQSMLLYRLEELYLRIEDSELRIRLLKKCIDESYEDNFGVVSDFVNLIELSHGKLSAKGKERENKIFDEEQLKEIELCYLEKLYSIRDKCNLLDLDRSRIILHLYKNLNAEKYKTYVIEMLSENLNKLKFICLSVGRWTSGSAVSWEVEEKYTAFLSDTDIIKAFIECFVNKSIWYLTEEQLHKVIAFILFKEKIVGLGGHVNDKDVIRRIKEMKNS